MSSCEPYSAEFELYRQEGDFFRSVRAYLNHDQFRVETQDMGPTVEEIWGEADYEFWTTVPKEAWGDLLMALTREFLSEDEKATDKLRDICMKYGIQHSWQQWI